MQEFLITIDLSGVIAATQNVVDEQILPLVKQVVWATAQQVHINWIRAIRDADLWSGEKDLYASTVDVKETGPFSAVVWSDYKYSEDIENGRPAYDQKRMLQTSNKTRLSKAGKRYLIIPFRHNVPGGDALAPEMPADVYALAKNLSPSSIVGQTTRVSATGAIVPQNKYIWGGRLPAGSVPRLQTRHKSDPYAGMVRFNTQTPGGGRHSSYLTFRVMSEGSSGWILPPKAGQHIVQKVVEDMRPRFDKAIAEAFTRTR